jgi:hypothetical protein
METLLKGPGGSPLKYAAKALGQDNFAEPADSRSFYVSQTFVNTAFTTFRPEPVL